MNDNNIDIKKVKIAKKLTCIIPNFANEHIQKLKETKETSISSIITAGIEILYWIQEQQDNGFIIKADKKVGNKIISKEFINNNH